MNLDKTFGKQFGGEIAENIILMLRIEAHLRPSATNLFEIFGRLCGSIEGPLPDHRKVEKLEEPYAGLSLQVSRTEVTLNKE